MTVWPTSPLYLPHICPASRPHLACISRVSPGATRRGRAQEISLYLPLHLARISPASPVYLQVRHDVVELKDDVAFDLTTDQVIRRYREM